MDSTEQGIIGFRNDMPPLGALDYLAPSIGTPVGNVHGSGGILRSLLLGTFNGAVIASLW